MPHLFDEFTLRGIKLRNRIGVSPMCQYSSENGKASDWHLVHLGSRAVGGAGLVMMEATAVEPEGRISPQDNGIWSEEHIEPLQRITSFIRSQGSVAAIQLAHAGRKASQFRPWDGEGTVPSQQGGWQAVGPSAVPFGPGLETPKALSPSEISKIVTAFAASAERAKEAGFELVEIHGAHGYLVNEFLSPLSNLRSDEYGGSFENRTRLLLEIVRATRRVWPDRLPLAVRLSATDWADGGWTIEDSIRLSTILKTEGVDFVDVSSGGNVASAKIPVGASYQVPFAERIKREASVPTAAVGMITDPMQADDIVRNNRADLVFLARELLRDPYWPLHAAKVLHQQKRAPIPVQYTRAF